MITALLLAQLAGPPCGYWLGTEITPEDAPITGCTLSDPYGRPAVLIRQDSLSPSGYQATPATRHGQD
jgi:hypothetical protein